MVYDNSNYRTRTISYSSWHIHFGCYVLQFPRHWY